MRDIAKDAQRVILALLAGFVLYFVLWGGVPFGLGFLTGRYTKADIAAKRDTVRVRDSVRLIVRDTVRLWRVRVDTVKSVSDRLDSAVVIASDSTVVITDTVRVVPPLVIADLRALRLTVATQDTLLHWWERKSAADSLAIEARDKLIVALKPSRCNRRCGFVLGIASAALVYKAVK